MGTGLEQTITDTLANVCDRLTPNQHFWAFIIAQIVIQLTLAMINYIGFTKNPNVEANTLFQASVNFLRTLMSASIKRRYTVAEVKKAYDFKDLQTKIMAKGGPEAEKFLKVNLEAIFEWLKESSIASENKYDDVAVPLAIGVLSPIVMGAIDHVDGKIY